MRWERKYLKFQVFAISCFLVDQMSLKRTQTIFWEKKSLADCLSPTYETDTHEWNSSTIVFQGTLKSEKKPIVNDDSFLSNICKSTIFKWKIFLFIFMNIQLIKFNGWQTLVNRITYKCIEHGSNYLKILIKEFLFFFFFCFKNEMKKCERKMTRNHQ